MSKIQKITFLKALLSDNNLPPIYSKITNNNKVLYENTDFKKSYFKKNIFIVQDIPDYLNLNISEEYSTIKTNVTQTLKGHFVQLNSFKNINEYLTNNFSPKSRSNLRRYLNRFEKCFNIKYVTYYGDIPQDEYNRLFVVLKALLIRRFEQKKELNYELQHLSEFQDIMYAAILNKKANLFVIYHDNKPISIRINMLKNNLAYYILSGYDIDYSKFHLGAIDMLKNIEWCINNKFAIYDLLKGYDYYKKKWATTSHNYHSHIIYDASSFSLKTIAFYKAIKETILYKTYDILKSYNLHVPYKKIKKFKFTFSRFIKKKKETKITVKPTINTNKKGELIDIEKDKKYTFLRETVYNFLFINHENITNIKVYKITNRPNYYFQIVGLKKNQSIYINSI